MYKKNKGWKGGIPGTLPKTLLSKIDLKKIYQRSQEQIIPMNLLAGQLSNLGLMERIGEDLNQFPLVGFEFSLIHNPDDIAVKSSFLTCVAKDVKSFGKGASIGDI